jgi:tetratricopeptide (TPR) repeat protein
MQEKSTKPVAAPTAKRRLTWRRKAAFSLATVLAFFLLLELSLAALGVKPATQTRDPFVGFAGSSPLFVRQGDEYVTNPLKTSFFNEQRFSVEKGPDTYRVFCLGGSTTFGHPYDYRVSYPEWLKARLEEVAPQRKWEVINCGGISYASYRLARLTEELVQYEPDLFIVYTGHNEFLEERTYGDVRDRSPLVTGTIRVASYSRTFNLLASLAERMQGHEEPQSQLQGEVDTILEHTNGPKTYERDPQWQAGVLEHYRFSLEKIVRLARQHDAEVILIQPASNLKDFSPFKSEFAVDDRAELRRWNALVDQGNEQLAGGDYGGAAETFLATQAIDDRHALMLFTIGQALFDAGRRDEALAYFVRARDEDVCPLRATSEMQQIVAEVGRRERVEVIDFPAMLARQCRDRFGHEAVGVEFFLDHVHPRLTGHADLGLALCETMAVMGIVDEPVDRSGLSERIEERVIGRLTPYDYGKALHTLAMTLSWAGKNEEALKLAEGAVMLLPDDSEVQTQYGRLLEKLGRADEAFQVLEKAVADNPNDSMALGRLAEQYGKQGRFEQARDLLLRAVENTPDSAPLSVRVHLRLRLEQCYESLGDPEAARKQHEAALALDPTLGAKPEMGSGSTP